MDQARHLKYLKRTGAGITIAMIVAAGLLAAFPVFERQDQACQLTGSKRVVYTFFGMPIHTGDKDVSEFETWRRQRGMYCGNSWVTPSRINLVSRRLTTNWGNPYVCQMRAIVKRFLAGGDDRSLAILASAIDSDDPVFRNQQLTAIGLSGNPYREASEKMASAPASSNEGQ